MEVGCLSAHSISLREKWSQGRVARIFMRPIGQLETEEQARTFADYLFLRNIPSEVEQAQSGAWVVWVVEEERVDEGKALLSRFRSMPDAEEFYQAPEAAKERRRTEEKESREVEQKLKRAGAVPYQMGGGGFTLALLVLSVAAAVATQMGNGPWTDWLRISNGDLLNPARFWDSLQEVARGQVWRLVTPIFIHYSLWHLVFNLLWMQDMGSLLESRIGTWRFAGVVLAVAVVSNVSQYVVAGAGFGGMSGVVYGVFGYIWIRNKLDVHFDVFLSPMTSGLLMLFLALGIFGLMGPTANAAHFSGLLVGAGLGWQGVERR